MTSRSLVSPMLRRTASALLLAAVFASCAARGPGPGAPATPASAPGPDEIATLDALLVAGWHKAGVVPAPIADDGEFLRRVTLDVLGRPPRREELRAFFDDRSADKRTHLVDRLLADAEAGEHWAD